METNAATPRPASLLPVQNAMTPTRSAVPSANSHQPIPCAEKAMANATLKKNVLEILAPALRISLLPMAKIAEVASSVRAVNVQAETNNAALPWETILRATTQQLVIRVIAD